MNIVKIQDHPDLVKDLDSKAVLNTNYAALLEYKNKQRMINEMDAIKCDIMEMKNIMNKLLSMMDK